MGRFRPDGEVFKDPAGKSSASLEKISIDRIFSEMQETASSITAGNEIEVQSANF